MTDEPDNLVFDEESGVFIPRQEPVTGQPDADIPVRPRERIGPKPLMTDAEAVRRNDWKVGDILEGSDGIGSEMVAITALGLEKVLGKLVATKMKGKAWVTADQAQSRERMFSFLNKTWKIAEPI